MKSLPFILCLTISMSHRALPGETDPFRLQLNGQSKVRLDLAPVVSAFYHQLEESQRMVNQRPRNEILKPPAQIASKLSSIETGMNRMQTEEILGSGWFEIGGDCWSSGYQAEYMNRAFPNLMIQVWYGWTERRFIEGRLSRKAGPNAPILASPAVVETKMTLPDAQ